MDQLHLLILLSVSMLIGAFFSGIVPMTFKMSDSKSRLLALMGSGILVGTALAVIIPEGIDSIYVQPNKQASTSHNAASAHAENRDSNNDSPNQEEQPIKTWTIGLSMVAGFILMLLIDQFSIYQTRDDNIIMSKGSSMHSYSLANQEDDNDEEINLSREKEEDDVISEDESKANGEMGHVRGTHRISMRGVKKANIDYSNQLASARITKVTPTLGLVIHASADGIALGAAATTSHRDVQMIIFLAIMLHKAPAAFSLVVLLLHKGLKHSTIRRHLLAFSLSAPIAALLTYFGLSQSGKEALRRNNATGLAMLFSAGTFLYVATVHVLPDLLQNKLLSPKELSFLVGGAFLPILLTLTI